nr:immunoglobulin light chain junction region [Macaca mulatta]MPO07321.1 immunoglobulin light chain junction region [Macaca mulatta]MPO08130.1 immunoglobulin light chain junction region [Macaca mulatta]MPO08261.1 immunoglobulin light chain junction region [Macaca mulatta]MPO08463.1 immunoglobulin light chain junction region [Macaca mulatta]
YSAWDSGLSHDVF